MDQKLKKRAIHRAKILRGQLDALIKAIDTEEYCTTLLHQSLSIQRSLKSLDGLLLENHLKTHVRHQMQKRNQVDQAIRELVEIYTVSNK